MAAAVGAVGGGGTTLCRRGATSATDNGGEVEPLHSWPLAVASLQASFASFTLISFCFLALSRRSASFLAFSAFFLSISTFCWSISAFFFDHVARSASYLARSAVYFSRALHHSVVAFAPAQLSFAGAGLVANGRFSARVGRAPVGKVLSGLPTAFTGGGTVRGGDTTAVEFGGLFAGNDALGFTSLCGRSVRRTSRRA